MRLLLDTHIFVWVALSPERLSEQAYAAIADSANTILLSAVCAYEIEFKRDRDPILRRLPFDLISAAAGLGLNWLAITPSHARAAGMLPRLHGDPFDRILIAQAREEAVPLVTSDSRIEAYDVATLW